MQDPDELDKMEDELEEELVRRMRFSQPRLRTPPPLPPAAVFESWASDIFVSPDSAANILHFTTQYYLSASGKTQPGAGAKVVLTVSANALGLSAPQRRRLESVAGPRFMPDTNTLRLVSRRFPEAHRNKEELRHTLRTLIEDARQNGEAHAWVEQNKAHSLPLASRSPVRSECWLKGTFGSRRFGRTKKHKKPQRARTSKP